MKGCRTPDTGATPGPVAAAGVVVAVAGAGDTNHVAWDAGDEGGEGVRDGEEELGEAHFCEGCGCDEEGNGEDPVEGGRVVACASRCEGEGVRGENELWEKSNSKDVDSEWCPYKESCTLVCSIRRWSMV